MDNTFMELFLENKKNGVNFENNMNFLISNFLDNIFVDEFYHTDGFSNLKYPFFSHLKSQKTPNSEKWDQHLFEKNDEILRSKPDIEFKTLSLETFETFLRDISLEFNFYILQGDGAYFYYFLKKFERFNNPDSDFLNEDGFFWPPVFNFFVKKAPKNYSLSNLHCSGSHYTVFGKKMIFIKEENNIILGKWIQKLKNNIRSDLEDESLKKLVGENFLRIAKFQSYTGMFVINPQPFHKPEKLKIESSKDDSRESSKDDSDDESSEDDLPNFFDLFSDSETNFQSADFSIDNIYYDIEKREFFGLNDKLLSKKIIEYYPKKHHYFLDT